MKKQIGSKSANNLNFSFSTTPNTKKQSPRQSERVVQQFTLGKHFSEKFIKLQSVYQCHNEEQSYYIEELISENLSIKQKLKKITKQNQRLTEQINNNFKVNHSHDINNKNQIFKQQNVILKRKLIRKNQDFNKLYYELQLLKKNNHQLRKDTIEILSKNLKR